MSFWDLLDMLPRSTAVKPQGCQLLFCKLFSFWQRKKLIKLVIFCDEILSGPDSLWLSVPSRMTVGGGGLNADRAKYYALLHALSLSRLRDTSLPEGGLAVC